MQIESIGVDNLSLIITSHYFRYKKGAIMKNYL